MSHDYTSIRDALERLRTVGDVASVFGAESHRFALNPVLAEPELISFEQRHGMRLPAEYRGFLTNVGNGGAGPYYGLFPLRMMDDNSGYAAWEEGGDFVGILREPFPHTDAWNIDFDPNNYGSDKEFNAAETANWSPTLVNGATPICHRGCALRDWLVVTGPLAGHVWYDRRTEWGGLEPVLINGRRASFLDWYRQWLDQALAKTAARA